MADASFLPPDLCLLGRHRIIAVGGELEAEWRFAREANLHKLEKATVYTLNLDLRTRTFAVWQKDGIVMTEWAPERTELALPILRQLLPPREIAAALAATLIEGRPSP